MDRNVNLNSAGGNVRFDLLEWQLIRGNRYAAAVQEIKWTTPQGFELPIQVNVMCNNATFRYSVTSPQLDIDLFS